MDARGNGLPHLSPNCCLVCFKMSPERLNAKHVHAWQESKESLCHVWDEQAVWFSVIHLRRYAAPAGRDVVVRFTRVGVDSLLPEKTNSLTPKTSWFAFGKSQGMST